MYCVILKINNNKTINGMLKRLLFSVGFSLVFGIGLFAQSGTIQGTIKDEATKEPIPFANVVAMVSGLQKGGAQTDFDGNYTIKPLEPGLYDVVISCVGYNRKTVTGVRVTPDQIRFNDVTLTSATVGLEGIEVVDYAVPLIQKDKTSVGGTMTSEEIDKMPEKSVAAVAMTVGGVFSRDGDDLSIRGQRSEGTVYYIDGIKVTGTTSLPQSAYDQISVILGGVPAQYGDVTGGVVSITTKGPSRDFGMGIEYETSGFGEKRGLDAYGHNRVGVNLTGPLIKSKNPEDPSSILGYFLAVDAKYNIDGRPTAKGVWVAEEDFLNSLMTEPIRLTNAGNGVWHNASFATEDNLRHRKSNLNTPRFEVSASGKIDVRTTPNMNLSFGGNYNYYNGKTYSFTSTMFNHFNNQQNINQTWRVYGRLYHKFNTGEDAVLKNVYYTLQVDYSQYTRTLQDETHKDNLFDYGYIGQYKRDRVRSYNLGTIDIEDKTVDAMIFSGYVDQQVEFTKGDRNPYLANYMEQYYQLLTNYSDAYRNFDNILGSGGLLNGSSVADIYSLFRAPGLIQSGYQKDHRQQFGVSFMLNADVKKHAFRLGFQFEQRIDSYYFVGATNIWQYMRQFANNQISELDLENPHPLYTGSTFSGWVDYDFLYNPNAHFQVDKSLRGLLGLEIDGREWIDVDSYDPVTNSMGYYDADGVYEVKKLNGNLSMDMFSADELIDNGIVDYRGYDAYGNRLKGGNAYTIEDFLKQDDDGSYARRVGASRPTYMAFYLQDVFSFRDLIFNVGVRVDRFDANQDVLKDPYLFFEAYTVDEFSSKKPAEIYDKLADHIPSNMGGDYVIYVDNIDRPDNIMGFRYYDPKTNTNTWYDANGTYITDPETVLNAGNGISPLLKNNENISTVTKDVFVDYKPQWKVMPRISFSFPISDDALFFAHYDILTQRPTVSSTLNISDYYYMPSKGGSSNGINNPNLRPETTIEYEIGFQQKVSHSSALIISAFYRELRDQIQILRFTGAFPRTYYSYENLDFGTIKGLTATYDLRRTKNIRLKVAYTLQFANGTGSDANATRSIVTSGQPNLRTLTPLNEDQRHRIVVSFDYRFGEGKNYNGPKSTKTNKAGEEKTTYWLQNTGLNVQFGGGTGTPYTRAQKSYNLIDGKRVIDGSINGSRMPAFFNFSLKLDRDFILSSNKNRTHYLNVYLQVLNVLNTASVLNVYSFTGNANNDGYLSDPAFQTTIQQQLSEQSYRLLYSIRADSPSNYSGPRLIRIGVGYNF